MPVSTKTRKKTQEADERRCERVQEAGVRRAIDRLVINRGCGAAEGCAHGLLELADVGGLGGRTYAWRDDGDGHAAAGQDVLHDGSRHDYRDVEVAVSQRCTGRRLVGDGWDVDQAGTETEIVLWSAETFGPNATVDEIARAYRVNFFPALELRSRGSL